MSRPARAPLGWADDRSSSSSPPLTVQRERRLVQLLLAFDIHDVGGGPPADLAGRASVVMNVEPRSGTEILEMPIKGSVLIRNVASHGVIVGEAK
jgi:hypothetical protein